MINSITDLRLWKRDQLRMELSGKLRLYVKLGILKKQQNMERFKFTENPRVAYMTACNLPCCHHHPTADKAFAPISDPYLLQYYPPKSAVSVEHTLGVDLS